ncbi:MAG: uracil-DNA glycosylase [Neisseriales bacterium]|nr:MAG: uracil-DNA glycosylase [Neisseriales bacterium]
MADEKSAIAYPIKKLAYYSSNMGLGPLWVRRDRLQTSLAIAATPTTQSPKHVPTIIPTQAPALSALAEQPIFDPNQPLPSWEVLRETVETCQRCHLAKTRLHTVFGRGSTKAKWLLVGEAPGKNEDEQGFAFVGRAGKLLDNMLKAIHLDSNTDVFMTNVLKCRPPGNRNPEENEVVACQDFLSMQIAKLKPSLIITLGRFAVQALLHSKENISALRGKVHDYQGIPLIVTFHPAYLLRNPPEKAKAWQDLVLAMQNGK